MLAGGPSSPLPLAVIFRRCQCINFGHYLFSVLKYVLLIFNAVQCLNDSHNVPFSSSSNNKIHPNGSPHLNRKLLPSREGEWKCLMKVVNLYGTSGKGEGGILNFLHRRGMDLLWNDQISSIFYYQMHSQFIDLKWLDTLPKQAFKESSILSLPRTLPKTLSTSPA